MLSCCRYSDSVAAAASQASHARRALLKVARDGTCSSSPSIFAAFVHVLMTRAWRCSSLRLCSEMVLLESFCGRRLRAQLQVAIGRWYSRSVSTLGETRDI